MVKTQYFAGGRFVFSVKSVPDQSYYCCDTHTEISCLVFEAFVLFIYVDTFMCACIELCITGHPGRVMLIFECYRYRSNPPPILWGISTVTPF